MYAATENEKAKEVSKIKHGLFTYYFLDAINNDSNYDSEGILTPNRIQDYIARETSKESEFKQTPVIENRTIGYYPFAFKEKPKEPIVMTKVGKERNVADEASSIDKIYFPEIPNEIRQQVFAELTQSFISAKDKWFSVLKLDEYDITIGENLSIFNRSLSDSLTDSIAIKSRNENIEAVSNLFSLDRVENTPNPVSGMFSIIDALTQKKQPKYTYFNNIQWGDERIISFSINLKSKNIYKVSCGLVVVVYQAVYGIGVAYSSFYMDYTGYADTQINGPFTNVSAFKIHSKTIANIIDSVTFDINYFLGMIEKWNKDRQSSINAFGNKAK
jgi:hypothetical protein